MKGDRPKGNNHIIREHYTIKGCAIAKYATR